MIKEAFVKLSYLIFPRRCEICGEVVEFDKQRCDECLKLSKIDGAICDFCGHSKSDCVCKKHKNEYVKIIAPYYYDEKLFKALHRFKFNNFPELSNGMAKDIFSCINERYSDVIFDYVTFVPLSKKKLRKRGYNQAALLAKEIAKCMDVEYKPLLVKVFDNKEQRTQNSRQRKVNVYGAYDLLENVDVKDKTILLIDDVKTTGSTLNECAKMLKIYGAKEIYVATFAITKNKKIKEDKSKDK